MNKEEVIKTLEVLKGFKPALYKNMSQDDLRSIANAWFITFKDYDAKEVLETVQYCCANIQGIPDIAVIKNRLDAINEKDPLTLWESLVSGVKHSRNPRAYEALPEECKKFVGSPRGLADLGMLDINTFNSVTKGQFLREVKEIKKDISYKKQLSQVKELEWNIIIKKQK